MNDNFKHLLMLLAFGTVTVTVVCAVTNISEKHDDHLTLEQDELKAWSELVNNYHSH